MSFIEDKRREQVIDATIAVLARHGVAQASLSRIAAEAGISKSIISYHFDGKDALIEQVFVSVGERIEKAITPAIESAGTAWGRIAAYVEGQFTYMRDHREELLAIGHIALSQMGAADPPPYIDATAAEEHQLLRDFLADGQARGEFRAFDTMVMDTTLSSAIEGALSRWARHPEIDLDAYARNLLDLVHHAIRANPHPTP
jgi:AcrR family transcriptional regulator